MIFKGRLSAPGDDPLPVVLELSDTSLRLRSGDVDLGTWPLEEVSARHRHGREYELLIEGEQWIFVAEDAGRFEANLRVFTEAAAAGAARDQPEAVRPRLRLTFLFAAMGGSFVAGIGLGGVAWHGRWVAAGAGFLLGLVTGGLVASSLLGRRRRRYWAPVSTAAAPVEPPAGPTGPGRSQLPGAARSTSLRETVKEARAGAGAADGLAFKWHTIDEDVSDVLGAFLPPAGRARPASAGDEEGQEPADPTGTTEIVLDLRASDDEPDEADLSRPEEETAGPPHDDLTEIHGIGPALEKALGELGYTTFRQIALLDEEEIQRVQSALGRFASRIRRDDWMASAARLHLEKYGKPPAPDHDLERAT